MAEAAPQEHLDVLVVGAGISGIGAARYLRTLLPGKSFAILEARATSGGTWDLFRYPGVRSDSDLQTFGYGFKPWRDPDSIAAGPKILAYLRETMAENGLEARVRYHHRVVRADWTSGTARWTVQVERADTGERLELTAGWMFCGTGYYRYDEGFTPAFAGLERFRGQVVHPQHWPTDLDHRGRRVVVIGSGATAVTLAPALAEAATHVTVLQRTPAYVVPVPTRDRLANRLVRVLGADLGHAVARRKNIAGSRAVWLFCRRWPRLARRVIRRVNARALPAGYPVDEHFAPPYDPWDQRLCVAPDGDFFRAIRSGRTTMVTDRLATFTESGLELESGRHLEADLVVTATGLTLQVLGGIEIGVDGRPVDLADTVVHRGMLLSGVPNLVMAIGYPNASWTLKIGLLCEHFCRLLRQMDDEGHDTAVAVAEPGMATRPLLDLRAGYVRRSQGGLPRQGLTPPWVMSTSYDADRRLLRRGVGEKSLHLSGPLTRATTRVFPAAPSPSSPPAAPSPQ